MAMQARPPSLVDELNELKRRIVALERKPKLGSVNQRMPFSSYQTPWLEGVASATQWHTLGSINSTGLNQPVLLCSIPFAIPLQSGAAADVSVTVWLRDMVTGQTSAEFTLDKTSDGGTLGATRTLTWSWIHPQPIGFDDANEWKAFAVDYRVNKTATINSQTITVGMGGPQLITGVPLGTYVEESTDGNPRIAGTLTPTDGGPVTWG